MTLTLETKSHGDIESGFFSFFTQLSRLGKYTFGTEALCTLTQYLAKNPNEKEAEILGCNVNKFWELEEKYSGNLVELISNASKATISQEANAYFEKNQGKLSEEYAQDLFEEGEIIQISIDNNRSSITIGEYEIENIHFGRMMCYLTHGGWMGWPENAVPDYVKPTIESMKNSKNHLFRKIQKEFL